MGNVLAGESRFALRRMTGRGNRLGCSMIGRYISGERTKYRHPGHENTAGATFLSLISAVTTGSTKHSAIWSATVPQPLPGRREHLSKSPNWLTQE